MDLRQEIEHRLIKDRQGRRRGGEIDFLCVSHENTQPGPASWNPKKASWNCLSCGDHGSSEDLARKLGIEVPEKKPVSDWQEVGHWDFHDENGNLLFRHVKYLVGGKKQFQFHRPDGKGGWIRNREGIKPVLYRLPSLKAASNAEALWVCEGEKDADSLISRGLTATSTPDGAQQRGKDGRPAKQRWYADYNRWFAGRDVVLLPDNDQQGRDFMDYVAAQLLPVARSVKLVPLEGLAEHGDVTDWLIAGGSVDELIDLAEKAPAWEPAKEPQGLNAFALSDVGNGEAFSAIFGHRVRYDWQRGRWLIWGQHRWQEDPNGELYRMAKEAVRERWRAAADEDSDRRSAIAKWCHASESEGKLQAMLTRARSEPPIADDGQGWDAQPFLLAAANGVINLVTGELQKGNPADRISMGTPLPYEPDARCPRFEKFFAEILPDPDVREFVRRAIGYSLTGSAREQVWFMAYGSGANGKGTLFDALRWVMGDYAHVMSFSTIERGKETSIPADLAALAGKRLVLTSETQEHSRMNEARVKSLTGEDPITARELYQKQFTFEPVLKLWVAVNHKPAVTDDSHGYWRRLRLLPFTETFGPDRMDHTLRETLKKELTGILAWCVRAAVDWAKHGLPVPPAIALATVEYRQESDPFADFISECCVVTEAATVGASRFYKAYKTWCEDQGMREREVMTSTRFGKLMRERFNRVKGRNGNEYQGVGMAADGWAQPSTGGGFVEGSRTVEGWITQKGVEEKGYSRELLPATMQPSTPSTEPCTDPGCPQRHWRWLDGTRRHERRPE